MAKHYFAAMTRNKTSLAGTGLVIGSLTLMVSLIAIQWVGLRGGAVWHDAAIAHPQRLMIAILHWALDTRGGVRCARGRSLSPQPTSSMTVGRPTVRQTRS